ncbi:MAG: ABC transporter permease [Clostridia bacterium]|nr:ABC transporter permease [Clostridia bacterium]
MNVFHKITLQSLKRNKTRTVVTIIGIILSAAMICAVTTFASSIQNYLVQYTIYNNGDWHANALDADQETKTFLTQADEVESLVWAQQYGYALTESVNEYKPYLYLLGANEEFAKTMPVHITQGRYPQRQDEILLPLHLFSNGGVKYKIGDVVTLTLGKRMIDGVPLGQNNPFIKGDEDEEGETFQAERQQTFTVVGFYERPNFEWHSAPGYTALTLPDETGEKFDIYYKMKHPNEVYSFTKECGFAGSIHTDLLTFSGISQYSGFHSVLYSLAAIVIALIMFGSVSLIYNAFSISVSERTKQFGLLSSIGATKKQLRRAVLFEALAVSSVGIPLGILSGIGGIGVTLQIIGHRFESLAEVPIPLRVSVSPISVVIAIAVALITVLISAWIPSRRATKVSAVEAIRQTKDITTRGKDVKTSKLTYRLLGLSGVLAAKHYKRNRKKYRATVLSLFMSIVLFVSTASFTGYLTSSAGGVLNRSEYDLYLYFHDGTWENADPNEVLTALKSANGVQDGAYERTYVRYCGVPTSLLTEAYREAAEINPYSQNGEVWEDHTGISISVVFADDEAFRGLLKKHRLNETDYTNPESPLALAIDGARPVFNTETEKYRTVNLLKEGKSGTVQGIGTMPKDGFYVGEELTDENGNRIVRYFAEDDAEKYVDVPAKEAYLPFALDFGTVVYDHPFFISGSLVLLYPESMLSEVFPKTEKNEIYRYYFLSSDHAQTAKEFETILYDCGIFGKTTIHDVAAEEEEVRNVVLIIRVFAYGFVVLISLIAAANVFNTISTNISLRRREFAMLKSVGMTAGGFNRMMIYECLLYGSRALLWGLPVSVGVTYLIYLSVDQGFDTQFRLPLSAIGIAVLSVFAVVFVTMMYALRKIKKENPIDAMKNENL